ncbi:uncharacterized protein LOC132289371 [Cornus florida]|uniref:uncharacterized protein LOC132289371 n=1 Tax=Cornus florida TaxID=4283 RepID=UPI00289E97C4|nr:uncharacterized protein LOC132289371 [Cornus florida]
MADLSRLSQMPGETVEAFIEASNSNYVKDPTYSNHLKKAESGIKVDAAELIKFKHYICRALKKPLKWVNGVQVAGTSITGIEEGQSSSPLLPVDSLNRTTNPTTSWCCFFSETASDFKNLTFHSNLREKKVSISEDDVAEEIKFWSSSVVGYVMGKKPYYHYFKSFVEKRWSKNFSLVYLKDGFFLVRFHDDSDVMKWSKNVNLVKEVLESVPVWMRIYDLPVHCRKQQVVSMICSSFAKPIYMDVSKSNIDKGRYLRVTVEVNVKEELPDSMVVDIHGVDCVLEIEYEWKPQICTLCQRVNHVKEKCPQKGYSS